MMLKLGLNIYGVELMTVRLGNICRWNMGVMNQKAPTGIKKKTYINPLCSSTALIPPVTSHGPEVRKRGVLLSAGSNRAIWL